MEKRQTFLKTELVDLVLLTSDDAETIARWFNDPEVTAYLSRGDYPMTLPAEREYLEKIYADKSHLQFGLWHRTDQKLIGTTGLHHINGVQQTAGFGIVIGDKDHWSNGIGTEVLKVVLAHGFGRLNLRSVTLSVLGNNPRGKRCYEKGGFAEVGKYSNHVLKDGVWHDEILMIAKNPAYV